MTRAEIRTPPMPNFLHWFEARFSEICGRIAETTAVPDFRPHDLLSYFRHHRLRFRSTLQLMLPELTSPGERRFLDVGGGQLAWFVADRFPGRSFATHTSDVLTDLATRLGVETRLWDIFRELPPYPAETFDIVTFTEVLEHLPPPPFEHVRRVVSLLKPRGLFILSVPNMAAISKRWKFLLFGRSPIKLGNPAPAVPPYRDEPHIRAYTVPEVRQILAVCGLKVDICRTENNGRMFLNRVLGALSRIRVSWGPSVVVRAHKA
jgi:SAM-dependent methyltransferase